eukprot:1618005-Rhodomonas_salina.4
MARLAPVALPPPRSGWRQGRRRRRSPSWDASIARARSGLRAPSRAKVRRAADAGCGDERGGRAGSGPGASGRGARRVKSSHWAAAARQLEWVKPI